MPSDDITKRVDELLQVDHFTEDVRRALLDLGPEARKLLQDYATGSHPSGNPDIQGRAILTLGESHDPGLAVPALEKAMASPDTDIRVRAMRSLGRVGGPEATALLTAAVEQTDLPDAERTHGSAPSAQSPPLRPGPPSRRSTRSDWPHRWPPNSPRRSTRCRTDHRQRPGHGCTSSTEGGRRSLPLLAATGRGQ